VLTSRNVDCIKSSVDPHPRRIFKFAPIGYAGRETDF
jgi:hypothetical protein